jgi:DNA polymerase-3 subunit alpha
MSDLNLYFKYKCEKGLEQRGLSNRIEYQNRLEFEMKVVTDMNFCGYFLIVQDFVNWARENDIFVGQGRGSAAGSLVSYCLEITDIDPIKYGLLFERFINPDRISWPDIDLDFQPSKRKLIVEYLVNKYGASKVAHIGTFGINRAKNAVRSIARTLGHPYEIGDELSRLLLDLISGKPQPINTSIEMVPELRKYTEEGGTRGQIIELARQVEGLIFSVGTHAGGIVISNEDLTDKVPLFRGKSGEVTTQWEMNTIEDVGYIKFDILGVDALEKISKCLELINDRVNIRDLPHDDKVFQEVCSGNVVGMFQLEGSSGIRDLTVRAQPQSIEDICAVSALFRPGPLHSGYTDKYINSKTGVETVEYLVPELEPVLGDTYGCMIYQEQIMKIATSLCGYTRGEADELRKGVGKKKLDLLQKHTVKFKEGWIANGLPPDKCDELWNNILNCADYLFNKSHSLSYSYITYQTAYLKTHYPTEFMCAVMTTEGDNRDDVIKCITECKRLGIKVLPPDINKSGANFTISSKNEIRFGLGPIKNLGEKPVEGIITEREQGGNYKTFLDFCNRVNLSSINRSKVESLVRAGAFDSLHSSRQAMVNTIDRVWNWKDCEKKYRQKRETYKRKVEEYEQRLIDIENDIKSATGNKLKPFKKPVEPTPPESVSISEVDEMSTQELQKNEYELLGFYISSHPLEGVRYTNDSSRIISIEAIKQLDTKTYVGAVAVVTTLSEITTKKKKQKMGFLGLEDLSGSIEAVVFPSVYEKYKGEITEGKPLIVEGNTETIQTDDSRVTKIIVGSITPMKMYKTTTNELLEANINISRVRELSRLLEQYKGDVYKVRVTLTTTDGTRFRLPIQHSIGNYKGVFLNKITKL